VSPAQPVANRMRFATVVAAITCRRTGGVSLLRCFRREKPDRSVRHNLASYVTCSTQRTRCAGAAVTLVNGSRAVEGSWTYCAESLKGNARGPPAGVADALDVGTRVRFALHGLDGTGLLRLWSRSG
jgi:hypothetical protein